MTGQGTRLRQAMERGYVMAPGAYDALTAKLVEKAGFPAIYLTGGGFSRSSGFPDYGLMTLTEIAGFLSRVCDVVGVPVVADADNGHGSAINVIRTVREFERAGVAAFHMEDQRAPKKCAHLGPTPVVPVAEMVGKVKAAVDTRRDGSVMVIARSDSRAAEGLSAAIDRVSAYLEAGADAGFVEAPRSEEELTEIVRQEPRAVVCNVFDGGKTPALPADRLANLGYRLGIYPGQTQLAALRAARDVLEALKGGDPRGLPGLAGPAEREASVDLDWWAEREGAWMP